MHLPLRGKIVPHEPPDWAHKTWLAIGLTWIAGFVDIVGYMVLDRILNANMSGNTVEIAYGLLRHGHGQALARGWAVLMFVAGLIVCACIHEACIRHGILSSAAVTLGIEAVLLAGFVVGGEKYLGPGGAQANLSPAAFDLLVALGCGAMGLQNATLTRVGALTVRTTHVTGTLAQFAESWSRYIFWFYDKTRGPEKYRYRETVRLSLHHEDFVDAGITAALWAGFLAGAVSGAWLLGVWKLNCLFVPVAVLVWFVAADLRHPITGMQSSLRSEP